MSVQQHTYLTPEEYLAIERRAEYKSEYIDGVMYAMSGTSLDPNAMSGASFKHNTIVANVIIEIGRQLRGGTCRALPSDIKVRMPDSRRFFYPDISVVCGEPQFHDDRTDVLLNPTLIVEVLSESTAAFDRGEKFQAYQQIDSLQEYLLIAQDKPIVEQYVRQSSNAWTYTAAIGLQGSLQFPSIECTLNLNAVYDKVIENS